jgi:hypothetical protein
LEAVKEQLRSLNPTGVILETSSTTGEGIEAWCQLLEDRLASKRRGDAVE